MVPLKITVPQDWLILMLLIRKIWFFKNNDPANARGERVRFLIFPWVNSTCKTGLAMVPDIFPAITISPSIFFSASNRK
ncbi:MAG: hypothetical protein KKB32_05635 [Acidobacteria bacterium]|nr:hypothetical protein [Acidobacteriota bacterium]